MAKERPKCSEISKSDLFTLGDYTWAVSRKIGEGSYGKVYLGWSKGNHGKANIAVKHIRKEHLIDPKVCKNMKREIDILHALSDCHNVVRLWKDVDYGGDLVLFMELCDGDLDERIQKTPFNCSETKSFLSQMADGMKVLREKHVVHRDLKPQNILIKFDPSSGKMLFKIADFGFARFFKEENTKDVTIDVMYSLAGTPVFMAPEALKCVMTHGKTPYDEKVDLWSIGALLYKSLVGQCGFFAHMNQILPILEKKKDAIAFTRPKKVGEKLKYLYELPQEVQDRLPQDFCSQITGLLKDLLKVQPVERLSFEEFFSRVEELTRNNIELVDAMSGTVQRMNLSRFTRTSEFMDYVSRQLCLPTENFLLFNKEAKWLALPWSTTDSPLSHLTGHQIEESDPIVYVIRLTVHGATKPLSLQCVQEAADLLTNLPQYGSIVEPLKRLVGNTPNGLATLQARQLQGLSAFWLLVLSQYQDHARHLMQAEKKLTISLGSSVASVDSLRLCVKSLHNTSGKDSAIVKTTEEELDQLEIRLPKLTRKLNKFGNCMESLVGYSVDNFMHAHQQFEGDLQRLEDRISDVGKVDLSQMTDLYKAMISDLHKHVDMVQRHVEKCLGQTVQFLRTLEEANYLADPLKEEFRDLTEDASSLLKTSFQKLSESLSDATMKGETIVIDLAQKDQDVSCETQPSVTDCSECCEKDSQLRRKEEEITELKDKLLKGSDRVSPMVESTLTASVMTGPEASIEKTMDLLIVQLKHAVSEMTPLSSLEDNVRPSMGSFVMCETDTSSGNSEATKMTEMKNLLDMFYKMRVDNGPSISQGGETAQDSFVKITSDYNPGDLALIIQTKDPGILVVVNCEKGRVFVDKDSIKGHEQDFKRACIPGTPFMVGKVTSQPQVLQSVGPTSPGGKYTVKTQSYSLRCEPFILPKQP